MQSFSLSFVRRPIFPPCLQGCFSPSILTTKGSARGSSLATTFRPPPPRRRYTKMATTDKLPKRDTLTQDDPQNEDFFGPRPPPGYSALRAATSQILLPLTVSNKCGQAFRWRCNKVWEPRSGSIGPEYDEQIEWSLCLADRVVLLRQDEHRGFLYHKTLLPAASSCSTNIERGLEISRETTRWLTDYLSLDVPLESLYAEWAEKDSVFARFATRFSGLRMLRQDPWECLCAFVCSSNNNIARIGQMVQNLCTHFSPVLLEYSYPPPPASVRALESIKTEADGDASKQNHVEQGQVKIAFHPFPPAEALAKPGVEEKLRELGFGYRAKYLARTAQMLYATHGGQKTTPRPQKTAEHLDQTHWLYGIKAEEDIFSTGQQPSPPNSAPDDALIEPNSEPVQKRARRSRSKAQACSNHSAVKPLLTEKVEQHQFDSVRSYLQHLRTLSYREARDQLIQFPGIGPKVADCILLMSLDQASSIPVDRHVFQFAEKWYRLRTKKYEEIADYFRDLWGDYAGWAHSVLFTADLRSFANYKLIQKADNAQGKVESSEDFWGQGQELGYPTPPPSQVSHESALPKLEAGYSSPWAATSELPPQSLREVTASTTLTERTKTRPKRKSRLSSIA